MSQGSAIHRIQIGTRPAGSFPRLPDEDIAAASSANLLLTGAHAEVKALVRRIHDASFRTCKPCVQVWARDLPAAPDPLTRSCSRLVTAAAGGTLLVSDIEQMHPAVQARFIDLLDALQERQAVVAARVVTATTVSLFDLVTEGRFTPELFYRLNTIHLVLSAKSTAEFPPRGPRSPRRPALPSSPD